MRTLFGAAGTQAADAEWRIGLAQIKITPEKPIFMAGYASRTKPFDKVAADLFVRVSEVRWTSWPAALSRLI